MCILLNINNFLFRILILNFNIAFIYIILTLNNNNVLSVEHLTKSNKLEI